MLYLTLFWYHLKVMKRWEALVAPFIRNMDIFTQLGGWDACGVPFIHNLLIWTYLLRDLGNPHIHLCRYFKPMKPVKTLTHTCQNPYPPGRSRVWAGKGVSWIFLPRGYCDNNYVQQCASALYTSHVVTHQCMVHKLLLDVLQHASAQVWLNSVSKPSYMTAN
jgi:hypothetical protein